ncbi:ABC transporter permease [Paraburkholderia caballeronis]|uniref:Transport permease protein n=1 Tax=Paraburkholderia caballeronis TaxID=416943 RepID=A0A1H7P782_9BURK|nr:ABC transporter permease [Paraburkholderia caballeronis]PXW25351.1 ABC-2 type transport system permease protein [Paraburkholderia caballeronis]PXX00958.1 ABC-2 type transport system permease protein [Paraburkholderia caballeronis]RAJ99689.1 ABC-2 type transport system permease protein [Paraburkholderia caballeronis]TDV03068.1 ABC-2 type transport system permease protein [Paraburkholderia caballeronis]TDV08390.1 ABC-2 type transport system permease protein [Paraburkholderia caballeronis]
MFERVHAMLVKEFLELRRDRWAMFRLVVPLAIQVLVYGYAATFTVNHVPTAVLDLDHSAASRELVSHFVATGRFDVIDAAHSQRELGRDVDTGRASVAVVIHAGFAQYLQNGRRAPLQVIVDGTNSNTALIALGYVNQVVAQFQADWAREAWPRDAGAAPPALAVALHERPWFNPGIDDRWFFIPGVVGTLTLIQVVSLTAFAVVREREVGTLEQIMVSPIRPVEFILGKTVPFFLIGLGDVAIVTAIGIGWFRVPFVGNWLVMLAAVTLFLLATLGIGLLLSTFSRTQQQAFALNFFLVNPLFILSGFAFPIDAMPRVLQWLTFANPLRYFLVVLRDEFLKGVGIGVLWPQFAGLAVLSVVMLGASVLRFRKSLD